MAGLKRLGLEPHAVVLDPEAMVPAAGQGIIGVTVRADDTELLELLAAIEDPEAKAVSTAERAMLASPGRILQNPDRWFRARPAKWGTAPHRACGARRRLLPAQAQPARSGGGRRPHRCRARCQPARQLAAGHFCLAAVLITRPEPEASETARRVSALGLTPVIAPMLEIQRVPANLPLSADAVLLTSRNAIPALPEWARNRPILAVGDATAAATRAAGFTEVHSAGGNARDLARLVEGIVPRGAALLLLSGEGQGHELTDMLGAWRAERREVYRAVPVRSLPAAAEAALQAGSLSAALFFSGQTADCFRALVGAAGLEQALGTVEACAISEPAAVPLRPLPWRRIRVAARPTQEALLQFLA